MDKREQLKQLWEEHSILRAKLGEQKREMQDKDGIGTQTPLGQDLLQHSKDQLNVLEARIDALQREIDDESH